MASVGEPTRLREERKVVTPLSADLVGSTSIGERFDPEDARDIISGAVALMIEAVERFGGTIKDLAGDGVLALFGAPVSHEDDVERAVLAGLTLSEAVSKYAVNVASSWGHAGLDTRVGIDTGLAVVGPVGAGGRVEYGAVGDVLNTAFRLQSAARPGTVLVGETARREVADLFEWEVPAAMSLKGKEEPVVASVAIRPRTSRAREAASRPDALFVGRSAELATMDRALSHLVDGVGSAIFVIGEPGIGKSRLVAEAGLRARSGRYRWPIRWLEARCLSYADNVPYGLFRDLITGWLGLERSDGAQRRLSGLEGDPNPSEVDPTDASYLRLLLTGGRGDDQEGEDAETVRERAFAAVESTLIDVAALGPLVLSLEDLQWADATSLTLTERLVDAVVRAPIVIVATARPEPGHASMDLISAAAERLGPHAHTITLGSFTDEERRALMASLPGADAVPNGVRKAILDATDGNPFFLEEQFRSLADTGMLVVDADGRWRFEARGGPHIARTVERVLLARIDRLRPEEKEVLVAASVLGREFPPELVTGLVTADGGDVRSVLDSLDRIDLMRAERHGSEVRYRFRHSLIQEVAYRSLLKRERRALHARAAAAIESSHEGDSETVAGMLGHHLREAGEVERAVPHLMTAGDGARDMFANAEALEWYDRALEALRAIPTAERGHWDVVEANLQARRGNILGLAGRFEAARNAYRRSIELAESGDPLRVAQIRTEAAMIEITDHRYAEGLAELERAEQALGPVTDADFHDPERMSAWFDIQDDRMAAFYWMDDFRAYEELIDRVRPFVETQGNARQRSRFFDALLTHGLRQSRYTVDEETLGYARANLAAADEAGVASGVAWARFNLGFTLLWTGRFEESRDLLNQALREGSRIGDLTLVSRSRTYLMVLNRRRGDEREVERSIDPVIASAQAVSLPEYEAMAVANRSWVYARAERTSEAEQDARAALARWRSLPARYPFDWMASWPLISIELERGRTEEAIALARDLFAEDQQPVPDELGSRLASAIEAWGAGERDRARRELRRALPLARRLNYL